MHVSIRFSQSAIFLHVNPRQQTSVAVGLWQLGLHLDSTLPIQAKKRYMSAMLRQKTSGRSIVACEAVQIHTLDVHYYRSPQFEHFRHVCAVILRVI